MYVYIPPVPLEKRLYSPWLYIPQYVRNMIYYP